VRILVVEDEPAIADFIERGLRSEGHAVEVARDGEEGLKRGLSPEVELIVLDRLLPRRDGLSVLAEIRAARPSVPVIMLTALSGVGDRVTGLDAGATDYLVKPFALAELAARVRAHLRVRPDESVTRLRAGGIELDLLSRRVSSDGRRVHLSAKEFELLAYLMRHRGQVLTRQQLLSAVWGYDHDPHTNILEVYVSYLRRKLGAAGHPAPIVTVRSVGYRLADTDD
jgi:two-component system OmpR family response regulator